MNCEYVKKGLIDYVYDEMADDARHELEQHVERCAGCAAELKTVREFRSALAARPRLEPTPNLLTASRMRLQEQLESTTQAAAWRWVLDPGAWLRQIRYSPALAAGILMVGFAAGIMTTYGMLNQNGHPQVAATPQPAEAAIAGIRSINRDPRSNLVEIQYDQLQRESAQGSLDDPRIQELLLFAARSQTNSGVRLDSVDLLTENPQDNRVREALMYSLRYDKNPGVRLKALEGLRPYVAEDLRVRDAILEALLNDPNPGVRTEAIKMLQPVKGDGSVRLALEQLAQKDENKFIRNESRRVLATLPEID
ncbi:MAG TPA: HEAT repeat domain-containing protein [Terriglobales bacterium]|nr:HEAT repeat domain-containing protein [Terriglobales bacterium]